MTDDDLAAERERLMAEQERLLREGVPIEDLVRLVDVGDQSMTGDEAPKVTTPPASVPALHATAASKRREYGATFWSLLAGAWDQGYMAHGDGSSISTRDDWPNPYREAIKPTV